ncbi:hypothetical protein CYLTODRAFT_363263, partial [Cylindrobasidium torrendii FP15055 ss-10]
QRDPETAENAAYGWKRANEALAELLEHGEVLCFEDVQCGQDYIDPVSNGTLQEHNLVGIYSWDSLQLYEKKKSDTWLGIFIIANLHFKVRYQKSNVRPTIVVGGPDAPKDVDSFLFPTLHHMAALMNEGLKVWDVRNGRVYNSKPYNLYDTSDTVGLTDMNGWVGHTGHFGCRFMCGMQGRHKQGAPMYYPAMLKPENLDHIPNSCHPDYDINNLPPQSTPEAYQEALKKVLASTTNAEYNKNRTATGITKPSLFAALPRATPMPRLFPSHCMHRDFLNYPQLQILLFRGKISHNASDKPEQWLWAVLTGNVWEKHGALVAKWGQKLPLYVAPHPPRNPVHKINSGYKACEYQAWLYILAPGFLYTLLPHPYFSNLCQFIQGAKITHSFTATNDDLREAQQCLLSAVAGFETLYYGRKLERLHFVCQSIHSHVHTPLEQVYAGCSAAIAQWTIERTIGIIESLFRQHSAPYAHLSAIAVRLAQVGTLHALNPGLKSDREGHLPRGASNLGNGYAVLAPRQGQCVEVTAEETRAIQEYSVETGEDIGMMMEDVVSVERRGGLQLPNGQRVRTKWKETLRAQDIACRRYVQVGRTFSVCIAASNALRSSITKGYHVMGKYNISLSLCLHNQTRTTRITTPNPTHYTQMSSQ